MNKISKRFYYFGGWIKNPPCALGETQGEAKINS